MVRVLVVLPEVPFIRAWEMPIKNDFRPLPVGNILLEQLKFLVEAVVVVLSPQLAATVVASHPVRGGINVEETLSRSYCQSIWQEEVFEICFVFKWYYSV